MHASAIDNALLVLDILHRIPRRNYTTSVHLHRALCAAGHDLSLRTLQRHLDAIVRRFPIECDTRSKPYGYRWLPDAQGLHLPHLTPAEALLLELARAELSPLLPARLLSSLDALFASARREIQTNLSAQAERRWLKKARRIPDSQPLLPARLAAGVFETISEALYAEKVLDIEYHNARGQRRQARIWPLGLVQQGNRLYLVCRFEGHDNQRILALPRISQARMQDITFPWPQDFDLDAYCYAGHFGVRRGPRKRLSFCIDATLGQHLLESPLAADQTVHQREGRLEISATVEDTELLRRWLRGWGEAVSDIRWTDANDGAFPCGSDRQRPASGAGDDVNP